MGDIYAAATEYLAALDVRTTVGQGTGLMAVYSVAQDTERDALDALRAAVATPPDTGWRDRAPYSEEVYAHEKAHPVILGRPRGLWMVRGPDVLPTVVPMYTDGEDVVAAILDETIRCHALADGERNPVGYWWRPLTASGDPCAWPEVTP